MKKLWPLKVLVFVVIIGGVLAVRYLPCVVPYWQCSEVYKRYHKIEGVRATYIKDYRLNDTLTIAVTLLEATTDSGWVTLQEDFGVPVIPKEYEKYFYKDSNKVSVKYFPKSVPLCADGDTIANDIIAISRYKHAICHCIIQDDKQRKAFMNKQFDNNLKSTGNEQND